MARIHFRFADFTPAVIKYYCYCCPALLLYRTNATVMDTRERMGAPVLLGVGPMAGGSAGKWRCDGMV